MTPRCALAAALLVLLVAVTGSAPADLDALNRAAAARLRGAGHAGADVSWPQCPRRQGGSGLPAPPGGTEFVVVGVTDGRPWTRNPCMQQQLSWAVARAVPAQAYLIAGFPSAAQLSSFGARGPWPGPDRGAQLRNAGYAEGRHALDTLAAAGFRPPMVWLDVEPVAGHDWPTGTRARQQDNRLVLAGLMRALASAGVAFGLYSYPNAWRAITGDWRLPAVPVWATAGRAGPAAARRACARPGFSAGPVLIAQWYSDIRDSDLSCPPFRLMPAVPPLPPDATGNG